MKANKTFVFILTVLIGLVASLPLLAQRTAGANTQVKTAAPPDARSQAQANNFASRIEGNSRLSTRVESMLPTGESLSTAAAGFKNQGQFLAALHASHNLNIPFDDLKAKLTGSNSASLGAAIHTLRPYMSQKQSNDEAKKAEAEARAMASAKAN